MKKLTLLLVVVAMFVTMGGVAMAADSPHGPFAEDTDLCAACHRAHTATGEYLLAKAGATALCIMCHSSGQGADTDVVYGNYIVDGTRVKATVSALDGTTPTTKFTVNVGNSAASRIAAGDILEITSKGTATVVTNVNNVITIAAAFTPNVAVADVVFDNTLATGGPVAGNHTNWGTAGSKLLGGGFNKEINVATTSKHMNPLSLTPVAQTYWDVQFGEATSPGTAIATLDCVDCHMPHRSSSYRMLRTRPEGANVDDAGPYVVAWNRDVAAPNTNRNYTLAALWNVKVPTGGEKSISEWCGACHDYYYNFADKASTDLAPGEGAGKSTAGYYSMGTLFTHAVDVDMAYTPRNQTGAGIQHLHINLGTGTYANKLPVAAVAYQTAYDDDSPTESTDRMTCLTCHAAHGSSAVMNAQAELGAKSRLGITGATENLEDSFLLRLTNRAVCETCHKMPIGYE